MATAAARLALTHAHSWWEDEVRSLLDAAPELGLTARPALRRVLLSLAAETAPEAATLADMDTLVRAVSRPVLVGERAP